MKARINRIQLKSGDTIEVSDGVTVIVGPNNSGKSLILRELSSLISSDVHQQVPHTLAIDSFDFDLLEDAEALLESMRSKYEYFVPGVAQGIGYHEPHIRFDANSPVSESQLRSSWNPTGRFGMLSRIFLLHFMAENRTQMTNDESMFDLQQGVPGSPLQKLFIQPALEVKLNEIVKKTFGQEVTVHRHRGTGISLHLGKPQTETTWPPTREYLAEMNQYPTINSQGDGMRSFIGIVLTIIAGDQKLLLVDEPEAFLHPPQARSLGRVLAELRQEGVQIIVATHSNDIIQGITGSVQAGTDVSIHRLSRRGNSNHSATIPTEAIKTLYTDPLLKYSSVLDGLFYHGVVLCESEGDCTYYAAVNDELPADENGKRVDLHFTHCSGKDRMPKAIEALRAAKVPVASVFDIDLLQNRTKLAEVITAHGGEPDVIIANLPAIVNQVNARSQMTRRSDAKEAIFGILDASQTTNLSQAESGKIRTAVKDQSGWAQFKLVGRALLTAEALTKFNSLVEDLKAIGIFIVTIGELERFHAEVPAGNKAKWLQQVLTTSAYRTLGEQQPFVESIRTFVQEQQ